MSAVGRPFQGAQIAQAVPGSGRPAPFREDHIWRWTCSYCSRQDCAGLCLCQRTCRSTGHDKETCETEQAMLALARSGRTGADAGANRVVTIAATAPPPVPTAAASRATQALTPPR